MSRPLAASIAASAMMTVSCVASMAGPADAGEPPLAGDGPCNAAAANGLIGEPASQPLAAEAMRLSGARAFRWIPIDSAVTMDYRPDRLNVELDENSVMRTFRCG